MDVARIHLPIPPLIWKIIFITLVLPANICHLYEKTKLIFIILAYASSAEAKTAAARSANAVVSRSAYCTLKLFASG